MGLVWTADLERFQKGIEAKIKEIFARKSDIPQKLPASGGDADTVNGHTVNADVPEGAEFTDTVYTHPGTAGHKHIPAGGASGKILRWKASGEAEWGDEQEIPDALPASGGNADTVNNHEVNADVPSNAKFTDTNTTYGEMKGATASAAGAAGLVPAPAKGIINSFLRGDGTWAEMTEATDADIDAIVAGTFK